MKLPAKNTARLASAAIAIAALLTPITLSSDAGIQSNDACADGACCKEMLSFCGEKMDAYESASGNCDTRTGPDYTEDKP